MVPGQITKEAYTWQMVGSYQQA